MTNNTPVQFCEELFFLFFSMVMLITNGQLLLTSLVSLYVMIVTQMFLFLH